MSARIHTLIYRKGLAVRWERYVFSDNTMFGVSWTSTTMWNLLPGWVLCFGFIFGALTVYRTYDVTPDPMTPDESNRKSSRKSRVASTGGDD